MKKLVIVSFYLTVIATMFFYLRSASEAKFANGSEKYLNGYRLDLPEELSTVVDNGDEGRKDTLIAYKDTVSKTIYIQFK